MKIIKRIIMTIAIVIAILVGAAYIFMQQEKFGRQPRGERLERIKKSPHYKDGKFQNLANTPDLAEGIGYYTVMRDFFFAKSKRSIPDSILPSRKIDLHSLNPEENIFVWFGHSSYFLQLDGKKFLVDPVFSGGASPVRFTTLSFNGSDVYTADDMPPIDYLFITHDHWDHLDYKTVLELKSKVNKVITGLGTGEHFEYWGYDSGKIIERDWNEKVILEDGFAVHLTPARHFSGRSFSRNKALWTSFVLQTPNMKVFLGGDSGYGPHFKTIGEMHGPFDLAILECGQYHPYWKYIHMMPEEVVQASEDLNAKVLLPVHWGKFSLALHDWDDPILRVVKESKRRNIPILHPLIGEEVNLNDTLVSTGWWEDYK
jgi:L-ascorbate metabolism protein UlaG (beta-lactamase superfamily)